MWGELQLEVALVTLAHGFQYCTWVFLAFLDTLSTLGGPSLAAWRGQRRILKGRVVIVSVRVSCCLQLSLDTHGKLTRAREYAGVVVGNGVGDSFDWHSN